MSGRKFDLGRVVATPGALERIEKGEGDLALLLARHVTGDWGDLPATDKRANEEAIRSGARILSAYLTDAGKVWIITDAATDACPACTAGVWNGGDCEPGKGEWHGGLHFRTDLPARRLSTTILLPEDY
jgi:hypothetical protein